MLLDTLLKQKQIIQTLDYLNNDTNLKNVQREIDSKANRMISKLTTHISECQTLLSSIIDNSSKNPLNIDPDLLAPIFMTYMSMKDDIMDLRTIYSPKS